MKKVLSVLLLTSLIGTAYGACQTCEWKNHGRNAVVRKSRAAKCWVARNVLRNPRHNVCMPAKEEVQETTEKEVVCKSQNCPICNPDKACKNFCTKCGKHHRL